MFAFKFILGKFFKSTILNNWINKCPMFFFLFIHHLNANLDKRFKSFYV